MWIIILLSSLGLSSVSAFFSTVGMTTIFPSAFIAVIVMCAALEIGKIVSVLFLHRHWHAAPKLIKSYLIISIFILMFINSIGIFGYLSKAHIEAEVTNQAQSSQIELVLSKLENEKSIIKDLDNQRDQIDNALSKLTETGRASTALSQANAQRKQRDSLVSQKNEHLKIVQDLTTEKIKEESANKKAMAEFGPLTYIADAFYGNPSEAQLESTVRWIIGILVLVFDPLALVLLIASQYSFNNRKKNMPIPDKDDVMVFKL